MRNGDMSRQTGFTYLLTLFALAMMGLLLSGAGQVWQTTSTREKEADLLFIGNQFREAIASYYERTDSPGQYPQSLEELVDDKRFPPRRHLRKIFVDPMTGTTRWGLVKAGDRIVGVHSLSDGTQLKTSFQGTDAVFQGAAHYDQWVFRHDTETGKP